MRGTTTVTISVMAMLLPGVSVASASTVRKARSKCLPKHAHIIAANRKAEIFAASDPPGLDEYVDVYGCVNGGSRTYHLGALPSISSQGTEGVQDETLAGTVVAYEEYSVGGYYSRQQERRVVVRDLRNGRVLHRVPTGVPLNPEPEVVGVGNVVAIVVKSDGAVAWIADDYGRTVRPTALSEFPYFDLEAVDRSGSRLLASGTGIDPSSLALSVGGVNIGRGSGGLPGTTLYWTQAGHLFSSLLN